MDKDIIAGIDVSTKKIAVVTLYSDNPVPVIWEAISTEPLVAERFSDLIEQFYLYMIGHNANIAVVETIPFVQNARTALALANIEGAVRAVCSLLGIPCEQINNSVWKKTLGIGRTKEAVAAYVEAKGGYNIVSQDAKDAYCIVLAWKTLKENNDR